MNLAATLTAAAAEQPDAVAIASAAGTVSYAMLAVEAGLLAGGLTDAGIRPGDRVAIACGNDPTFVVAYLAALHAGAVAVPLNPTAPAVELGRELAAVSARMVIASPAVADAVRAGGSDAEAVVAAAGDTRWDQLRAGTARPMVDRADSDVAVLVFTSGTSGAPKAAMLTHRNLRANIEQVQGHPGIRLRADDVVLGVLPLFHIYGLNVVLGVGLAAGAQAVVLDRFDPAATIATIRERGVTMIAGAPPMFAAWVELDDVPSDAFASVRLAVSGAAPMPAEVQRAFRNRYGIDVHEGYGLTEAAPIVTSAAVGAGSRDGSIGPPLPGVEVRLVDPASTGAGDDVLVGDPGEIWVRGPNVFAGYWDDPDATARVLTADGWLRTGDVAVADDDGWLTIVDRQKDLIIVSGFNVYPAEVEDVLRAHPSVREAAVVGVPDARTGEAVLAFVVLGAGVELDEAELIAYCASQLARYKCPATVTFVSELPHSDAGKVLRRTLRNP